MILVAFPAIHRSVTGWLERYFGLLSAIRASCLMHLSWTAWSETASPSAEAASSIIAHIFISWFPLVCSIEGRNRKFSHDPFNLDLDFIPDFRSGHKNYKALNSRYSIPLSGNALDCDIMDPACRDWSIFILFCKQFLSSFGLINQLKKSTHRRDNPWLYKLLN